MRGVRAGVPDGCGIGGVPAAVWPLGTVVFGATGGRVRLDVPVPAGGVLDDPVPAGGVLDDPVPAGGVVEVPAGGALELEALSRFSRF